MLAAAAVPDRATLSTGAALALRYVAEIALGPLGGALAGRHGARRLPVLLSLTAAVCLAMVG